MGNCASNNLDTNDCFCVFSDSDQPQKNTIVGLEKKYTDFPKEILNDIDSNIATLSNQNDNLGLHIVNLLEKTQIFDKTNTDINKEIENLIQQSNSIEKDSKNNMNELFNKINLCNENSQTNSDILNAEIIELKKTIEQLQSKVSNIDNTMTGVISNEWNVLDNTNIDENSKEKND